METLADAESPGLVLSAEELAARMRGEEKTSSVEQTSYLDVWYTHLVTTEVFSLCEQPVITNGVSKAMYRKVSATECVAALRLAGVPEQDWPEVGPDVIYMSNEAAQWLNNR